MMLNKWEYEMMAPRQNGILDTLNELGQYRWELIKIEARDDGRYDIILKRRYKPIFTRRWWWEMHYENLQRLLKK